MDDKQIEELLRVGKDVRFLLWINNRREVESLVTEAFENPTQKEAFRLLADGKSYREIGSEVGKSHSIIGEWVKRWRELGLVDPNDTVPAVNPETLRI